MTDQLRRDLMKAGIAVSLVTAAGMPKSAHAAQEQRMSTAFGYEHVPVPLPFDAKGLKGLSEKLIQSHWENNYGGAVKALNLVRSRLQQALVDANTPPYVYNGLKR